MWKTSAGESVFLNPTSGGIALFTTTRVVAASGNNANLNKALIDNLFQEDANSRYVRLIGDDAYETSTH